MENNGIEAEIEQLARRKMLPVDVYQLGNHINLLMNMKA